MPLQNGRLILSPVPLTQEMQTAFGESPAVFMDLASLRRGGLRGTLRRLRSLRASSVTVAGTEADLAVFRDVLMILSLAIPADNRWYAPYSRNPVRFGWIDLPIALARLLLGVATGFAALFANRGRLRALARGRSRARRVVPRPRRCLYLKPALNFGTMIGGSVGHVAGVANALQRSGMEVRLVAAARQPMIDPATSQIIVAPHTLTAYPHELNLFRYHRKYLRGVERQVAEFRPDFIYQRYSLDDMSGIFLRRRKGVPLILEFNGSETWIQRHWGTPLRFQNIAERIEHANLRFADLVVVVSDEIKKRVCALGIPEQRVFAYPNCIDSTLFDPGRFDAHELQEVRRRFGIPSDACLFTFVGTFGQWHGTEVLAAAIRSLVDHRQEFLREHRVHFLMVGDGQYGEQVRGMLQGAPCVSLPGFRPQHETPEILAASDVCLSPHVPNPDGTPFFGSPTKLFEYMAMAKLIIASDLDQIGWVLRGWRPGEALPSAAGRADAAALLVDPGDPDSLIQAIGRAAAMDPAERSRVGERARRMVLQSYTWDRNVEAVLDRFNQLMCGR